MFANGSLSSHPINGVEFHVHFANIQESIYYYCDSMIETKDVVAKGLEIYSVYSTCPLCGREGEQKVVVITEPEKTASHIYSNI